MRNKSGQIIKENMQRGLKNKMKSSRDQLDEKTVLEAISGDTAAIMKILRIYEPYINKLSLRATVTVTEKGECIQLVDETVKKTLETSLIAAIMKFDPCKIGDSD